MAASLQKIFWCQDSVHKRRFQPSLKIWFEHRGLGYEFNKSMCSDLSQNMAFQHTPVIIEYIFPRRNTHTPSDLLHSQDFFFCLNVQSPMSIIHTSIHPSINPSIHLSIHSSIHQTINSFVNSSINSFIHPSYINSFTNSFIHLSMHQSIHPSIYP